MPPERETLPGGRGGQRETAMAGTERLMSCPVAFCRSQTSKPRTDSRCCGIAAETLSRKTCCVCERRCVVPAGLTPKVSGAKRKGRKGPQRTQRKKQGLAAPRGVQGRGRQRRRVAFAFPFPCFVLRIAWGCCAGLNGRRDRVRNCKVLHVGLRMSFL